MTEQGGLILSICQMLIGMLMKVAMIDLVVWGLVSVGSMLMPESAVPSGKKTACGHLKGAPRR
jgi:hypothetical protein